jgi:hypothetical protein
LSCSTFKVMWFLNFHFLLLRLFHFWGPMVPQFSLPPLELFHRALLLSFHPSSIPLYLLDCHRWNLEFFLISFQLVHKNIFISSMLSHILLHLLCKLFLSHLPLFLKLYFKVLHLVLRAY